MFFVLSKVLGWLIMPMSLIVISFLSVFIFRQYKYKKYAFYTSMALLLFFTNPYIVSEIVRHWEVPPVQLSTLKEYELGIILSGVTSQRKLPRDRVHFNKGADRLLHAVQLYKLGKIKKLLISGGLGNLTGPRVRESEELKKVAIICGVRLEDIITEKHARNTYENALYSRQLMESLNIDSALLITSAFHMRRASACFKKQKIKFDVFSTDINSTVQSYSPGDLILPTSKALGTWNYLIKEWVGLIAYKLMGYI